MQAVLSLSPWQNKAERYVGEFARAKVLKSENLVKVWGPTSGPEYVKGQETIQQKLKAIVNNYNLGYITSDEAIVAILKTVNGPRFTT